MIISRVFLQAAIFAAGAALMAVGIKNGELLGIMHKAIIICLECIGIG